MKKVLYIILLISFFSCSKEDIPTPSKEVIVVPPKEVVEQFGGYKVNTTLLNQSRSKDFGKGYWKNTTIIPDIIAYAFQKPKEKTFLSQGLMGLVCGDFNNDGWIDVYNLGAKTKTGAQENTMFLLWNPTTKVFDNVNLFNDKTIQAVSGGQVIPVYLNQDDYVDIVVISEGMFDNTPPPPRVILSDGKGGYDLIDIPIDLHPELISGDVGDLDGDGSPELVVCGNFITYIFKGLKSSPFFTQQGGATFFSEKSSPYWYWEKYKNNNGFGVKSELAVGAFTCEIDDVTGDGLNDLILSANENMKDYPIATKVMINQGRGYFDDTKVIKLPLIGDGNQSFSNEDFIVDDVNGDGLKDIISLNTNQINKWDLIAYVQQSNGNFVIDNTIFQYTINSTRKGNWKPVIIYQDFNKDGKKDITYHDDASGIGNDNTLPYKSVFIRKGNQFVEENYFQYDDFMKSLLPLITK
jgi:hypothetical protein